jgi:hypothetical protein
MPPASAASLSKPERPNSGPNDKDADDSPYADVKTDDGTVHRLWGVSLPKALDDAGISEGDTVTLRKDGVERFKVQIPIIDEETGQKRLRNGKSIATSGQPNGSKPPRRARSAASGKPSAGCVQAAGRAPVALRRQDDDARFRERGRLPGAGTRFRSAARHRHARFGRGRDGGGVFPGAWRGLRQKREQVAELWERASVALGLRSSESGAFPTARSGRNRSFSRNRQPRLARTI